MLFRDIQPDAFYPMYGDSSLKQFDAQTSGRFYARVDRGLGYVMYGDLQTSSFSPAVQQLGAYNRALTGVQHHFENKRTMFNVFASHDSLRQVIDEFAALGISGPYPVSNPTGVSGTERVEIVTRDRNQPALVLSTVPLTRFTDYEFEPFSGRLLFRRPVPALDERFNPVVNPGDVRGRRRRGRSRGWAAANLQVRLGGALQMGGSWIRDSSPGSPFSLSSVNTTLRLGSSSTIVIEGAQSTGTINTGIGGPPLPCGGRCGPRGICRADRVAARVEPAGCPRLWRHHGSGLQQPRLDADPRPDRGRRAGEADDHRRRAHQRRSHSLGRPSDGRAARWRSAGGGDEVAAAGARAGPAARDRNRRARAGSERRLAVRVANAVRRIRLRIDQHQHRPGDRTADRAAGIRAATVGRRDRAGGGHAARRHDHPREAHVSSSGSARTCTEKANRTCASRPGASPPSARSS